jgi:hypothetical protein
VRHVLNVNFLLGGLHYHSCKKLLNINTLAHLVVAEIIYT